MSQYKECEIADVVPFWFAANTATGTAGDGATPTFAVRLAGASASAAPTATGTPTLLTHASYSDGSYEILVDTTGYTANAEYGVFCSLTISSVNPNGFVGSIKVRAVGTSVYSRVTHLQADYTSTEKTNVNHITADVSASYTSTEKTNVNHITADYGSTEKTAIDFITATPPTAGTITTAVWAQALSDLAAGSPSATASAITALNWLYEAWRNKSTVTATTQTLFKDDSSTPANTSTLSDDGTTFTKTKVS